MEESFLASTLLQTVLLKIEKEERDRAERREKSGWDVDGRRKLSEYEILSMFRNKTKSMPVPPSQQELRVVLASYEKAGVLVPINGTKALSGTYPTQGRPGCQMYNIGTDLAGKAKAYYAKQGITFVVQGLEAKVGGAASTV